jgi:hypothetical protein
VTWMIATRWSLDWSESGWILKIGQKTSRIWSPSARPGSASELLVYFIPKSAYMEDTLGSIEMIFLTKVLAKIMGQVFSAVQDKMLLVWDQLSRKETYCLSFGFEAIGANELVQDNRSLVVRDPGGDIYYIPFLTVNKPWNISLST